MLDRTELREKYGDEMVLVAKRGDYPPMVKGYVPINHESKIDFLHHLLPDKAFYMLRCDAEHNPTVRQIIPYIYLVNNKGEYFVTKRLPSTDSEERLHNSWSLGIGGHVDMSDDSEDGIYKTLINGAIREIGEEVTIITGDEKLLLSFDGVINDCESEVSKDHIGYVFQMTFEEDTVVDVNETHKCEGEFMTPDKICENYYEFESWSKLLAGHLFKEVK